MRVALVVLVAAVMGCSNVGIWIEPPPPPPPEAPVPTPFTGSEESPLEPLEQGLFRAPLYPHLFYYAPDDLWYRYWRARWYQAFRWDGPWFPPERIPELLLDGPL